MRFLVSFQYNGNNFHGWERQGSKRTVRSTIEKYLTNTLKEKVEVKTCSRTDAKVHALQNYFVIETKVDDPKVLLKILNFIKDEDIIFLEVKKINKDFDVRKVQYKIYDYVVSTENKNVFDTNLKYYYKNKINLSLMKSAAKLFVGTNNYLSFSISEELNTNKTIMSFDVVKKKNEYHFMIKGSGFLRYQIRMMVAFLLKINEGRQTIDKLKQLLNNPSKGKSVHLLPGHGLYLKEIKF